MLIIKMRFFNPYTRLKSTPDDTILISYFPTIVKALNFLLGNPREKVCAYKINDNNDSIGIIHRLKDGTFSITQVDI